MKNRIPVCASFLAAAFLAGCASTPEKTAADPKAAKEETVRYTPVGSHVSKRVKKPVPQVNGEENQGEALMRQMQAYGKISDQNEGSGQNMKAPK